MPVSRTPSPSKKRSRVTLAKFKLLTENKSDKDHASQHHSPNDVPRPVASNASAQRITNTDRITIPKSYHSYHVFRPSEGIDLGSFRLSRYCNHTSSNNTSNIISRVINSYSVVYQIQSNSTTEENVDNCSEIESSILPKQLQSKHRCIVEDFMFLKEQTEVCLLLPKLKRKQKPSHIHSKLKIVCKKSTIMFGNDRNIKFYLFSGFITSNPKYDEISNDTITYGEIMDSFRPTRNNGNGNRINLQQIVLPGSKCIDKPIEKNILVKWIDVLDG